MGRMLLRTAPSVVLLASVASAAQTEVLDGTYSYARIHGEFDFACVKTSLESGVLDFRADGTFDLNANEIESCFAVPAPSIVASSAFNLTYTLDKSGLALLDVDPANPGTDIAAMRFSWDREVVLGEEAEPDDPGLTIGVRRGTGLGDDLLDGDYSFVRLEQTQVVGGRVVRASFGTLTFDGIGGYVESASWSQLDSTGFANGTSGPLAGTYAVRNDGQLEIQGVLDGGAASAKGHFGFWTELDGQRTALTIFARRPTGDVTPGALDDLWWIADYGGDDDSTIPGFDPLPLSIFGSAAFVASQGLALIGGTEVWTDAFGGGDGEFWSLLPYVQEPNGSFALFSDVAPIGGALADTEDVGIFAVLGDAETVAVGCLVRDRGPMVADVDSLSVAAGGAQQWTLRAGAAHANRLYLILGSFSGTYPGIPFGTVTIPLNLDAYFNVTLTSPNAPPLAGSLGLLDAQGAGAASFSLAPGAPASLVGLEACHALTVLDLTNPQPIRLVGDPVGLEFVP